MVYVQPQTEPEPIYDLPPAAYRNPNENQYSVPPVENRQNNRVNNQFNPQHDQRPPLPPHNTGNRLNSSNREPSFDYQSDQRSDSGYKQLNRLNIQQGQNHEQQNPQIARKPAMPVITHQTQPILGMGKK